MAEQEQFSSPSSSSSATALSGTFRYVLIPVDESQPIEERIANKAGGLTDDALIREARHYFHRLTGAETRAKYMESVHDDPEQRKIIAQQIRERLSETSLPQNNALQDLDDDQIFEMFQRNQMQPTCDIVVLTMPTQTNGFTAVSMYVAEHSRHLYSLNTRATALMVACGHGVDAGASVHGDVFVGRAKDDEQSADGIWERMDFLKQDADPGAEWCRIARSPGGGGGRSGKSPPPSLSNLVQQQNLQVLAADTNNRNEISQNSQSLFGMNGAPPVVESWGKWTQTDEEVELRIVVDASTKAKDCKVVFGRRHVQVQVLGQPLLSGSTFDDILHDECTFTLHDIMMLNDNKDAAARELCVTLMKAVPGPAWPLVIRSE
jgi:hypothetical protein